MTVVHEGSEVRVTIDAPWHGDPAPSGPPGSIDRLWEHEVVELMLLGSGERYLELEFGPHGHYLVLELEGVRNVLRSGLAITYTAAKHLTHGRQRWRGDATFDASLLPEGVAALGAFAIHGVGGARRYLALSPPGGAHPDFHRLDAFVPIGSL